MLTNTAPSVPIFEHSLHRRTRFALLLLIIPVILSYWVPLWTIRLTAPQYPEGLRVDIYSYKLVGGHDGQDIKEINELNHYIGMRKLDRSQFVDLDWIPFVFGILVLLTLRQAVLGDLRGLIDLVVLTAYISAFAFARYILQLYAYGHNLEPTAPVKIAPFMPVVIGRKELANFITYGLPNEGSLLLFIFIAGITVLAVGEIRHVYHERLMQHA
jgi:copper chaperone NosL